MMPRKRYLLPVLALLLALPLACVEVTQQDPKDEPGVIGYRVTCPLVR